MNWINRINLISRASWIDVIDQTKWIIWIKRIEINYKSYSINPVYLIDWLDLLTRINCISWVIWITRIN